MKFMYPVKKGRSQSSSSIEKKQRNLSNIDNQSLNNYGILTSLSNIDTFVGLNLHFFLKYM